MADESAPTRFQPDPRTSVSYDLGIITAAHLFGEPDCTFVPLQHIDYDFYAEDSRNAGSFMREGMMHRLYGPTRLYAHCN